MIKEKLAAAIAKKNNDITTFVWKGRKVEVNGQLVQEEKRLVDCSENELRGFYNHCESMLHNDSKEYPGRYVLMNIIEDQRRRCNTELFLRWLEQDRGIPRFTFLASLRAFLDNNKGLDTKEATISEVLIGECPVEFAKVPVDMVLEGCLDKLGKFNKQHITLTFILKQGLWFTQQESKDLTEKTPNGEFREKAEVAKERLGLKPTVNLYMTPKGLSFTQLRAMVNLKSKKYSELTTAQLETLRNRILYSLEDDVKFHANQWETRKNQIKMVCESKGYTL
jgi:hypothetical protein